jgi:anti-anti-sigma regulatory factor
VTGQSETQLGLGGEMVIRLESTRMTHALHDLDRRLDLVLGEGPRTLVLDMSVAPVSSTTIAALLWTRRRCSSRGVRLVLRNPSRRCLDTLRRVGLLGSLAVEPVGHQRPGRVPSEEH